MKALLFVLIALVYGASGQSLCRYNLKEIEEHLNESVHGSVDKFVVNCLAAQNESYAESMVISAFGDMNTSYEFSCLEGSFLVAISSDDVSDVERTACTACQQNRTGGACVAECAEVCSACLASDRETCTACRYFRDSSNACQSRDSCHTLGFEPTDENCECRVDYYLQPSNDDAVEQYFLPGRSEVFVCVSQCREGFTPPTNNSGCLTEEEEEAEGEAHETCVACGVPGCAECANGVCTVCLGEYNFYRGSGDRVCCLGEHEFEKKVKEFEHEIEEQTDELEEEQKHEDEVREETTLLLRILLPIFCPLVAVVFVALSVFAHLYFPYVTGDKRRKTKPEDSREAESSSNKVWRPRPTIRLR